MQRAAKESAQKAISDREASQLERDQSRDRIESERDMITTEREAQVAEANRATAAQKEAEQRQREAEAMQKEKEAKRREQEHADAVRRQWQAQGKDALGRADDPAEEAQGGDNQRAGGATRARKPKPSAEDIAKIAAENAAAAKVRVRFRARARVMIRGNSP